MFTIALVAIGVLAASAASADDSHLIDVRTGRHPTFRRIVLVFDRVPDAALLDRGDSALELEIRAVAQRERTYFGTADSPIGAVELVRSRWTSNGGEPQTGLRLRAQLDGRRSRVFALNQPARLVVDIAPPGPEPFESPAGTVSIAEKRGTGPQATPVPELEIRREPQTLEQPQLNDVADDEIIPARPRVERGSSDSSSRSPESPATEPTRTESARSRDALADAPLATDSQQTPLQPTEPTPVMPPQTAQSSGPGELAEPAPIPKVAEAPPIPAASENSVLTKLIWVLGGLLAAGALWLVFSRSFRSSIEPATGLGDALELETASRLEALEKRMDEEVRSRVAMEERLLQLHEELKVMRDRLTRRARRPE